jgi:hypothetical protein
MGEQAARYMSFRRKPEKPMPSSDAKALDRIQIEAKEHGATLHSQGKGGLPPSIVLGVFRRDGWHCHKCGGTQDLTIHHKADILASPYLRKLHQVAGRTDPKNLATICHRCHDSIHEQARQEGTEAPE